MTLGELIKWLEKQSPNQTVKDGFGSPGSDRGIYEDVAFMPVKETTFGQMLYHAKQALGSKFYGYKGGEFVMDEYSTVKIGDGVIPGEPITKAHFDNWIRSTKPVANYKISACYFPNSNEVEFTFEKLEPQNDRESGVLCLTVTNVPPETGDKIAEMIPCSVYHHAIVTSKSCN